MREEEDTSSFGEEGFQELEEVVELGRMLHLFCFGRGEFEQGGVAADLTEFQEGIENGELGLFEAAGGDGFADLLVHGGADGFVKVALA